MSPSLLTPVERRHSGSDQARGLRDLVARRTTSVEFDRPVSRQCHTIVVAGGKGGVGRSVIALNLAILLAQRGGQVGLLDACPDFGNIELLCGLNGYWNLSHVAQGCRQLDEVSLTGPAGIRVVSGASELKSFSSVSSQGPHPLFSHLQSFESQLDWLVIDASGGSSSATREIALAADDLLIVATPEPTAVAEAYASVKAVATSRHPRLGLLVNQADSTAQAQQILDRLQQAAHSFLQVDLHRRGYIPRDPAVPMSVNERIPFVIQAPQSPAAEALRQLAQRWTRPLSATGVASFFSRLQNEEA